MVLLCESLTFLRLQTGGFLFSRVKMPVKVSTNFTGFVFDTTQTIADNGGEVFLVLHSHL